MPDELAEERRMILKMLEDGKITPDQAAELLRALGSAGGAAGTGSGAGGGGSEAGGSGGGAGAARGEDAGEGDGGRWAEMAEQFGSRVGELADDLARKVERAVKSGDVAERMSELGERMQEVGRTVAERLAQAFGVASPSAAHVITEEYTGEFAEDIVADVELISRNGAVTVQADPEAGRAWKLVVRRRARGRAEEEAEDTSEQVEVSHGPSSLIVRAGRDGMAEFDLTLPQGVRVRLEARSSNGAVTVRGVPGTMVSARSSNGRVDLSGIEAKHVVARTSNGALLLEGVRADVVEAAASNGSVTASVLGADVQVSSSNGALTLRPEWRADGPGNQRVEATSSNGSVRVILPQEVREAVERQELGLSLEAASSWGSARVEVPGTVLVAQKMQMGRQEMVCQSPNLASARRTLRVVARTSLGTAAVSSE